MGSEKNCTSRRREFAAHSILRDPVHHLTFGGTLKLILALATATGIFAPASALACSCDEPSSSNPGITFREPSATVEFPAVAENEDLAVTIADATADLRLERRDHSTWVEVGPLADHLTDGAVRLDWRAGDRYRIVTVSGMSTKQDAEFEVGPALSDREYEIAPDSVDNGVIDLSWESSACSELKESRVHAVDVDLGNLEPFRDRIVWNLDVDGAAGFHRSETCRSPKRTPAFIVAATCDESLGSPRAEIVPVTITGTIEGSSATVSTGAFDVDLRCNGGVLGGCATGDPSHAWPALLLLAGIAARRNRRD